jgi:glucan phosphoethanolaminetransferase (alkaline phosphatase superfamily)
MTFFMIWISNSTLAGGEIGMTPILVGIVLLIVFGIEMLLTLIFKKRLTRTRNKIIGLGIAFLLYELTMWFMSGSFVLLESFQEPFSENISGAYSFSSIISLTIILILILIKSGLKNKKTFYNNV